MSFLKSNYVYIYNQEENSAITVVCNKTLPGQSQHTSMLDQVNGRLKTRINTTFYLEGQKSYCGKKARTVYELRVI